MTNGDQIANGSKTYQLAIEQIGVLHVPTNAGSGVEEPSSANTTPQIKRTIDNVEQARPFERIVAPRTELTEFASAAAAAGPSTPDPKKGKKGKAGKGKAKQADSSDHGEDMDI